jgi:DNA-binding FadR family transcriptional regulator
MPIDEKVMDAIKDGDATGARNAMQRLLPDARDYMQLHIRDS